MAGDLKKLYVEQLQDLYSANTQMAEFLPTLHEKAHHEQLKAGIQDAIQRLKTENGKLDKVIRGHGADPAGEFCHGMAGLVKEAKEHGDEADSFEPAVKDALIIAVMQRMSHYGMAGYGTCKALAQHVGAPGDMDAIRQGLEDAKRGDAMMTQHAEGDLYPKAAE